MKNANSTTFRKRVKILGVLIPFFILGLTCEFILRTTHLFGARLSWSEPHASWGWRHSPGKKYYYVDRKGVPISGYINSFGWRDRERSLRKPKNAYRIAILGDSVVEALTVETDSTFCALVEDRLTMALKTHVEVMNFGRSGMTQSEEYLVLKQDVIQFAPDMVVLFVLPSNDIRDVSKTTAPFLLRPFYSLSNNNQLVLDTSFVDSWEFQIKNLINPIKQHSVLLSLLAERFNALKQVLQQPDLPGSSEHQEEMPAHLSLGTAHPDSIFSENYRLNKILIQKMAQLCQDKNIRFLLVCAHSVYKPDDVMFYRNIDPSFNADFFDHDLRSFSELMGFDFLGLQEPFKDFYNKSPVPVLEGGHWNYTGHRIISDVLCSRLRTDFQISGLKVESR